MKKCQNNLWNENCDKILKQYTKGIINYEEYCELMKAEKEKILVERQVNKDDKTRN